MAKDKTPVNPFLEENFSSSGGLWENKVITFSKVSAKSGFMGSDANPVIDPETGKRKVINFISAIGIADDLEFDREEKYSVGKILVPTEDGEGFIDPKTQKSSKFSAQCQAAEFSRGLNESGFDTSLLWDEKEQRTKLSKLNGAQFKMRPVQKLDKDKKPKTRNGFPDYIYYPQEFIGFKAGFEAPKPPTNELKEKAADLLVKALTGNNGKLTRIEAIKAIQATGDPDTNKIIALIGTTDFHKGQPWKVDASGYSL